ncbi:replication-relaxation family protein [Streptomyces chartreusis]|uniref:replication-relaxation family protein n=1 Tax=Streptomyces chartreusis TaxID=1969 RepID=UPI0036C458B3
MPLDWIPEVRHPVGSGEAVIADALLYDRTGPVDGDSGSMLQAFVEVERATMGAERLASKLTAYERFTATCPQSRGAAGRPSKNRQWRSGGNATRSFPAS